MTKPVTTNHSNCLRKTLRRLASPIFAGGLLALSMLALASCQKPLPPAEVAFAPPVPYMTGGLNPVAIQAADFNGDGKMDLAIANRGSATVAILFGNGDGTFQDAVTYTLNANGSMPVAIAAADFNGDGKPDIVAVNASSGASVPSITILLNHGDGTFDSPVTITTPSSGQSVAVGDLNADGFLDLWIGAPGSSFVMLGNGNGTFQTPVSYATSPSGTGGGMGVAIGDVNNDGKPDLAATNNLQNTVGILLNTGNGQFSGLTTVSTQAGPAGMAFVDFDHDGNLDMVVTNSFFNTAVIWYGAGNGTFQRQTFAYAGSGPVAVAIADFNGNGTEDLVFADFNGDGVTYLGDAGSGATYDFPTGSSKFVSPKPSGVVAVDLNGDGRPDLAVVNSNENTLAILLNQNP
jgi:FG-GAP-like repeat/FG-GAP repeat